MREGRLTVNQASGDEIQCLHTRQSKCPSLRYWTHRARHSSTARYFDNWRTSAQNDAGALRHGNGRRMSAILLRHRYPTRTKPTGAFKNKILGMDSNLTLGPVSRNQYFLHAIEWRERAGVSGAARSGRCIRTDPKQPVANTTGERNLGARPGRGDSREISQGSGVARPAAPGFIHNADADVGLPSKSSHCRSE